MRVKLVHALEELLARERLTPSARRARSRRALPSRCSASSCVSAADGDGPQITS